MLNMLPIVTINNPLDYSSTYVKFPRQSCLAAILSVIKELDLFCLRLRKDCIPALFPYWHSSFFPFVVNIILLRTQKQMVRVYTGWIVTFMQNEHSLWDNPFMMFPRKSMSQNATFYPFVKNANLPISKCCFTPHPKPAGIRFLNKFKEPFMNFSFWIMSMETWPTSSCPNVA